MRFGFLPPNSKDNFLNIGAAVRAICSPVAVPPVKLIAFMFGCSITACPVVVPKPCTMLSTPFGNPAL